MLADFYDSYWYGIVVWGSLAIAIGCFIDAIAVRWRRIK